MTFEAIWSDLNIKRISIGVMLKRDFRESRMEDGDQYCSTRDGKTGLEPVSVLKVESTWYPDRVEMRYDRVTKDDFR